MPTHQSSKIDTSTSSSGRLPVAVKPLRYNLTLTPSFRTKTFTGTVTISLLTHETTISLKLHVLDLAVHSTSVSCSTSSQTLPIASTSTDRDAQTYKILLEHCVSADTQLSLSMTFSGSLKTKGEGVRWFMPESCQEPGEEFLTTLFEPMFARSVFPCFDEPQFKAVFEVALVIDRTMTALGNMPVKTLEHLPSSFNKNGELVNEPKKIVRFEATPQMPTYLLAFAIGYFDHLETQPLEDGRTTLRAYIPKGTGFNITHTRYALNIVRRALILLASILRTPFPYPKLDLLLVPGSTGGMENPGLVTLASDYLILSAETSADQKIKATQTLLHEVAHMWFGNLITPRDWDTFWWKEGLAEWTECELRDRIWGNAWKDWVADGLQIAMFHDSFSNHPVEVVIDGEKTTKPFTDEISYKKGCALLRMLECYLGKDVFVEGLRVFVQLNANGSAASDDLWSAMSHVSGADVAAFMRPWMKSVGVPLVVVEEDEKSVKIRLSQSRFHFQKPIDTEAEVFPIPLEIATPMGATGDLLRTKSKVLKIPGDFIGINVGQASFFRVAYSPNRLQRILGGMKKGMIPVEDRIALIANASALCFSRHPSVRTSQLLELLLQFEDEENLFVWKMIVQVLNDLDSFLRWESDRVRCAYEKFWRRLVQKCLYLKGQIGADDDLEEQRFKSMMFGNAGGDPKILEAALVMFLRFVQKEGKAINPNIRAAVFKIVLTRKGKKEYNELMSRLDDCTMAERRDILGSLGYADDSGCIKKTIKLAMGEEYVTKNEMPLILKSLCTHAKGTNALWKFILSGDWKQNANLSFDKMIPIGSAIFTSFCKMEQAEAVRTFLDSLGNISDFGNDLLRVLELIDVKAKWLERDKADMVEWLELNGFGQSQRSTSRSRAFKRIIGLRA